MYGLEFYLILRAYNEKTGATHACTLRGSLVLGKWAISNGGLATINGNPEIRKSYYKNLSDFYVTFEAHSTTPGIATARCVDKGAKCSRTKFIATPSAFEARPSALATYHEVRQQYPVPVKLSNCFQLCHRSHSLSPSKKSGAPFSLRQVAMQVDFISLNLGYTEVTYRFAISLFCHTLSHNVLEQIAHKPHHPAMVALKTVIRRKRCFGS